MAISMYAPMKRRDVLAVSTVAAAAGMAWGQNADEAKLKRIGVMSLCFNSILKTGGGMPGRPDDGNRTVDVLDLAGLVAERYGLHYLEMQHSHFESTEPEYLAEFRKRLDKAKSKMTQINVEFGTLNISAPDRVTRLQTIDLTKAWIDHAVVLGCPRIMVNQGLLGPEVRETAIATLKTIVKYASSKKVFIAMENREAPLRPSPPPAGVPATAAPPSAGGPGGQVGPPRRSAPWDVLVEVCKAAGTYINPDLAYFADDAGRKAGLPVMYRMTSGSSHVKYNPDSFDTVECLKISKEVGYKGLYMVEGMRPAPGQDTYGMVKSILDIIVANI
jgi:hypothetical protein